MAHDEIEKEMQRAKAISDEVVTEVFQQLREDRNIPFSTPVLAISMTLAVVTQYYSRLQKGRFSFEYLQQTVDVVAFQFFSRMVRLSGDDVDPRLRAEVENMRERIRNQNLLLGDPGGTA